MLNKMYILIILPVIYIYIDFIIRSSTGFHDGLSVKVIRSVTDVISEPLSYIFNLTFISGNIPDNLKTMNLKIIDPYLFSLVFQNY